ncbi:MAG TPA: carboxyl transferase domain-containing protein, partial [Cellulomonas sp.]
MTDHPTAAPPAAPEPDAAVPDAPTTPAAPVGTAAKVADLADRYRRAVTEPEAAAAQKQHARGKRTARERIESLLDPGSFTEIDA